MTSTGRQCPTEDVEQQCLMRWAEYQSGKYPQLALLYHIPNGGKRGKAEAGRFRAMGVKSGVPDLCLPVPAGKWHGLYIELKRQAGGRVEGNQEKWIQCLLAQGYAVEVARGWEAAQKIILDYLDGRYQPIYKAGRQRK